MEIFLNSEQGIGAGARTAELHNCGKGELEQTSGGAPQPLILDRPKTVPSRPQRAPVAVFGALSFVPAAIIAEEVSESTVRWIERVFQECQIAEREILGRRV